MRPTECGDLVAAGDPMTTRERVVTVLPSRRSRNDVRTVHLPSSAHGPDQRPVRRRERAGVTAPEAAPSSRLAGWSAPSMTARRGPWVIAAAAIVVFVLASVLDPNLDASANALFFGIATSLLLVGALLRTRVPGNRVGAMLLIAGVMLTTGVALGTYSIAGRPSQTRSGRRRHSRASRRTSSTSIRSSSS